MGFEQRDFSLDREGSTKFLISHATALVHFGVGTQIVSIGSVTRGSFVDAPDLKKPGHPSATTLICASAVCEFQHGKTPTGTTRRPQH